MTSTVTAQRPGALQPVHRDLDAPLPGHLRVRFAGRHRGAGRLQRDGITDVATYTPKTSPGGNGTWVGNEGLWKIRGQKAFEFAGLQGDIPVPADYFGDGMTHAALFRPSTGQWFIRPQGAPQFGNPNPTIVTFGQAGDIPVPGDYNGDGVTDLAFYRPSTGQWFIGNGLNVSSPTISKPNFPLNLTPMVADYNGDGKTDIMGVDTTTGKWYLNGHGNIGSRPARPVTSRCPPTTTVMAPPRSGATGPAPASW